MPNLINKSLTVSIAKAAGKHTDASNQSGPRLVSSFINNFLGIYEPVHTLENL